MLIREKISVDLIKIFAESQSLGWWFSTALLSLCAVMCLLFSIFFMRLWYRGAPPLSVEGNQIFLWGKPRYLLTDFDKFLVVGEGEKARICGVKVDGSNLNIAAFTLMDGEPEQILRELNLLLI